jgi:hypothetical protein
MPTVHLDFYLIYGSQPLAWMVHEIDRMIGQRIDGERPMIIEGTYLLDVLEQIEWQHDFLVYVRGEGNLPFTEYLALTIQKPGPIFVWTELTRILHDRLLSGVFLSPMLQDTSFGARRAVCSAAQFDVQRSLLPINL